MQYAADVVHRTARKQEDDRFCAVPIEAADERDAVRRVADMAAARKYGDEGQSSWIEAIDGNPGHYLSFIGVGGFKASGYQLDGVTISIHVWSVE